MAWKPVFHNQLETIYFYKVEYWTNDDKKNTKWKLVLPNTMVGKNHNSSWKLDTYEDVSVLFSSQKFFSSTSLDR